MSEIIEGGFRYESVRSRAYWNNAHLDTRFHITHDAVQDGIAHLEDCRENPTIGLLARKKFRTNNYPPLYKRNLAELRNSKYFSDAEQNFKDTFTSMYPKTGKARKFLIDSESIVLNYVKPIQKTLRRMLFKLFH